MSETWLDPRFPVTRHFRVGTCSSESVTTAGSFWLLDLDWSGSTVLTHLPLRLERPEVFVKEDSCLWKDSLVDLWNLLWWAACPAGGILDWTWRVGIQERERMTLYWRRPRLLRSITCRNLRTNRIRSERNSALGVKVKQLLHYKSTHFQYLSRFRLLDLQIPYSWWLLLSELDWNPVKRIWDILDCEGHCN